MSTALLGIALTFATVDGKTLELTATLTTPATCALDWGALTVASTAARSRHAFGPLPVPEGAPIRYRLHVGAEPLKVESVAPIGGPDHLRFALYGDSRDGAGPHAGLVEEMLAEKPELLIHTGDAVHDTADAESFATHLRTTLELAARTPLIFAPGNHEIIEPKGGWKGAAPVDGLGRMLDAIPPPKDPLREATQAPRSAFHVRVGPALFIAIDSNEPLSAGSPGRKFLEAALAERGDARFVFVAAHQGPLSSGPHGGHVEAPSLLPLFTERKLTAFLAGHDHDYERLERDGVTYLVSGGGGAPLYPKMGVAPGSKAFASTYNWVLLTLAGPEATLEARSLEGALLDRATIAPVASPPHASAAEPPLSALAGSKPERRLAVVALSVVLMLGVLGWAGARLLRG
jgi:hypothetical protein